MNNPLDMRRHKHTQNLWKAVGAKNTWILTRQQRVFHAYFTRISRVKYVLLTREKISAFNTREIHVKYVLLTREKKSHV